MAKAPGGSFIPKRSSGKVTPSHAGKRVYVFSYIAYTLFFGTLLSVGGIFFLEQQAERQLAEHIELLEQERRAFGQGQLDMVRRLDTRLQLAEQILDRHAAPSVIFDELEPVVVETVQLTNFNYTRNENGGVTLTLGGLTDSFDILLFQRDVIAQSELLASAEFVEVQYGGGTNVIEGAERGPREIDPTEETQTRVTFSFEDSTVLEEIGYKPRGRRSSNAPNTPAQSETSTAGSEGGEVNTATQ